MPGIGIKFEKVTDYEFNGKLQWRRGGQLATAAANTEDLPLEDTQWFRGSRLRASWHLRQLAKRSVEVAISDRRSVILDAGGVAMGMSRVQVLRQSQEPGARKLTVLLDHWWGGPDEVAAAEEILQMQIATSAASIVGDVLAIARVAPEMTHTPRALALKELGFHYRPAADPTLHPTVLRGHAAWFHEVPLPSASVGVLK